MIRGRTRAAQRPLHLVDFCVMPATIFWLLRGTAPNYYDCPRSESKPRGLGYMYKFSVVCYCSFLNKADLLICYPPNLYER